MKPTILLMFCSLTVFGQDTLYLNSSKIVTKITSINVDNVTFGESGSVSIWGVDSIYLYNRSYNMVSKSRKHFGRHLKSASGFMIAGIIASSVGVVAPSIALPAVGVGLLFSIIGIIEIGAAGKAAMLPTNGEMIRFKEGKKLPSS